MKIKFYCPDCENLTEVESQEIENYINPYHKDWDYGSNLLCQGCITREHEHEEFRKNIINFNEMKVEIKPWFHAPINTELFFKEQPNDVYMDVEGVGRVWICKKYIIEDPNYRILPGYIYKDLVEKYGQGISNFEDENKDKWEIKSQFIDSGHYNLFRYFIKGKDDD